MIKLFQMIHIQTDDSTKKQKLMDTLLRHNLDCFGIGQHVIVLDERPEKPQKPYTEKALQQTDIHKAMKSAKAQLLTFDSRMFQAFKAYLSKEYVFKKATKTSMSYRSKTQPASFSIFKNGRLKTTKDLLDVALMSNLVKICIGLKPSNPQTSI